ncbi:hypothetical protein pdam_00010444 [Pocillopora damicornis]|uniref:ATP-dependent DNA helicase n=1 Tax=Pocillopora damicornis TaxID=46731 RepID=A0A3M6U9T8_POCDA|nr:hypothetical protein pdam_00010444 [Pocillopora damicornis]
MLTMNLWVSVGLCDGATGTPPELPIAVGVKFDDYRGHSITETQQSCVPICPITVSAQSLDCFHERQQVPLRLAYALTIHKSQ